MKVQLNAKTKESLMSVSQMTFVVVKLLPFMTSQDLIVSSFMTYILVCNKNTTTVATCGTGGTVHPSGALDFTTLNLSIFCVVFY